MPGSGSGRNGELLFNEIEFQFGKTKRGLEMDDGDGCTVM